jgi:hypothetical protein
MLSGLHIGIASFKSNLGLELSRGQFARVLSLIFRSTARVAAQISILLLPVR